MGVQEKEMLIKEISMKQPDIVKFKNNSRKWTIIIIVWLVLGTGITIITSVLPRLSWFNEMDKSFTQGLLWVGVILSLIIGANPLSASITGCIVYQNRKRKSTEMLDEAYDNVMILRKYFESEGTDANGAFFEKMTLGELTDAAKEAERRMRKSRSKKRGKKEEKEKADES